MNRQGPGGAHAYGPSRRVVTVSLLGELAAAGPAAKRPPIDPRDREAILALIKAVDLAQAADEPSSDALSWDSHILKAGDHAAYLPFRITLGAGADGVKPTMLYVRAVSRRDGHRAADERSSLRDWLVQGGGIGPRNGETVFLAPGEIPVGGPAVGSSRRSTADAAQAFTALTLREREYEKQRNAAADEKKRAESNERDPLLFPFEEYYGVDMKSGRSVERALMLPPGEYDLYAAVVDRSRVKTSSPILLRRTVSVPDFWSDQVALSSLILAKDVRTLKAPFAGRQQAEHPYAFGLSEVVPVITSSFTQDEALTVVFQMSNYGAPDADLSADYSFFRVDGGRRLFNRTEPQRFTDEDLPKPGVWETQAFTMQTVPLRRFAPGQYELEVTLRDRLTRATASGIVAFTVSSGVR
jgi:hypothetical protein